MKIKFIYSYTSCFIAHTDPSYQPRSNPYLKYSVMINVFSFARNTCTYHNESLCSRVHFTTLITPSAFHVCSFTSIQPCNFGLCIIYGGYLVNDMC